MALVIKKNLFADFCMSAGKDFTRNRKISFETVLKTIIGLSKVLFNISNPLLSPSAPS